RGRDERRRVARGEADPPAVLDQPPGDGQANASAGAGHHRDAVRHPVCHQPIRALLPTGRYGYRIPVPPGVDLPRLPAWLGSADEPDVRLIAGGRSNLTYQVVHRGRTMVLRRPPLGHVLATAHDMH